MYVCMLKCYALLHSFDIKFEEECKFFKKNVCAFKHVTIACDDDKIKAHKSQMQILMTENANLKEKVKHFETKIENDNDGEGKIKEHNEFKAQKIKIELLEKENNKLEFKVK